MPRTLGLSDVPMNAGPVATYACCAAPDTVCLCPDCLALPYAVVAPSSRDTLTYSVRYPGWRVIRPFEVLVGSRFRGIVSFWRPEDDVGRYWAEHHLKICLPPDQKITWAGPLAEGTVEVKSST